MLTATLLARACGVADLPVGVNLRVKVGPLAGVVDVARDVVERGERVVGGVDARQCQDRSDALPRLLEWRAAVGQELLIRREGGPRRQRSIPQ